MKTRFLTYIVMLIIIALPFFGQAQIPRTLSYQGVLSDNTGSPKPDGSYTFTFSLYDASAGGSAIWTETKTLDVSRGLFHTVLGDVAPLGVSLEFDVPYWLGIQVDAEPELSPRIPLTSVGYSFNSLKSDTASYALSVVGGAGDGHSLDADDGNPVDAVYVDGEGNVGIGTTSPFYLLDLYSNSGNVPVFRVLDDFWENQLQITLDNSGPNIKQYYNAAGWETKALKFWTGRGLTEKMRIDGLGNVGIGTTSPGAKLDVAGALRLESTSTPSSPALGDVYTNTDGNLYFYNGTNWDDLTASGSVGGSSIEDADSNTKVQTEASADENKIRFDTDGFERMIIDNTGNVGIGTTSPGTKLEVNGTISANAFSSTSPLILEAPSGTERMSIDDVTGNVGIGTTSPDRKFEISGPGTQLMRLTSTNNGLVGIEFSRPDLISDWRIDNYGGNLFIKRSTDNFSTFTNVMTFPYNSDNVGIGTMSPGEKLTVAGTVESTTGGFKFPDGTVQTSAGVGTDNDWTVLGNDMYSAVSGNIGIGTPSPSVKLEVDGNTKISSLLRANRLITAGIGDVDNSMDIQSNRTRIWQLLMASGDLVVDGSSYLRGTIRNDATSFMTLRSEANGLISGAGIRFETVVFGGTPTEGMRITPDGSVGIGTTSPGEKLTVAGTVESTTGGFKFPDGTMQTTAATGGSGDGHSLDADDGDPVDVVYVDGLGNVGIGTTSPVTPLHIQTADNPQIRIQSPYIDGPAFIEFVESSVSSGQRTGLVGVSSGDNKLRLTAEKAGYSLALGTVSHSDAITVLDNGNVGIGTMQPYGGLHVRTVTDIEVARFEDENGNMVVIDKDGNVGIGTESAGNLLTVVQGSATDPIADAWTTYSSRRWKTNIQTIESALDKVKHLRGVTYDWKADGKHDIGLIAEEVGEVLPEVVVYEENGIDAKSVDYARLVAVLIEAIKEQQDTIKHQMVDIGSLKEKMAQFESTLEKLEDFTANQENDSRTNSGKDLVFSDENDTK